MIARPRRGSAPQATRIPAMRMRFKIDLVSRTMRKRSQAPQSGLAISQSFLLFLQVKQPALLRVTLRLFLADPSALVSSFDPDGSGSCGEWLGSDGDDVLE